MKHLGWVLVPFVALLAGNASAGTSYGDWYLVTDDFLETETACLRYSVARIEKDDDELLARDLASYDLAARITTCDLRFVAQLRQGKLPREWEADRAMLSFLTPEEIDLLPKIATKAGGWSAETEKESWELLKLLATKAWEGQMFMALQPLGETARIAPRPPPNRRMRLFAGIGGDKREKRQRHEMPGWRISQALELYSKPTNLHVFGLKVMESHDHHSGAVAWVRGERVADVPLAEPEEPREEEIRRQVRRERASRRMLDSRHHEIGNEDLQVAFRLQQARAAHQRAKDRVASLQKDSATWTFISCNHGTCPGQDNMQRYAICEPGVSTEGWFAADGECEGWWGASHVCNDDTALQINNAFGIWSEDRCYGRKRPNRPWCQVHWQ